MTQRHRAALLVVLPIVLLAVAAAWSLARSAASPVGKGHIFGLNGPGVGMGGVGAVGKPVTFGFLEVCAVNAPVRITAITPLATTAPLRLRAGLSRAYPGNTHDRPHAGGGALPWKLGRLTPCGSMTVPTMTTVGVEVTRLTSASTTVNGLVVRFRDEKGGEHTMKVPRWHYTVHS